MTTSLHKPIYLWEKSSFFWTGLISLFTNLLCNSINIFTIPCKCSWFNMIFSLFCSFTNFYETTFSIISSSHFTLCFFHVSSLICLLISQTYLLGGFTSTLNHLWQKHNSHSISFHCKVQKDKAAKGTSFNSLLTLLLCERTNTFVYNMS